MPGIMYHPVGSAIGENEGAFSGSAQPVFVSCGYPSLCLEGCQAVYYSDIVFMGRSLFDSRQSIGILGDESDSGVCLCEINFR